MNQMIFTRNAVRIAVAYNRDFVAAIKDIDYKSREWRADSKEWIVFAPFIDEASRITERFYPDVELIYSDETTEKKASSKGTGSQYRTGSRSWYRDRSQFNSKNQDSSYTGSSSRNYSVPSTDHATLYVTPDAPKEVIQAAYRALAKKFHPDLGGDTAIMEKINVAYSNLERAWA